MKKVWIFPITVLMLVSVHEVSRRLMADSRVITSLFSAGGGPLHTILLALAFVALRLVVILMLPGFIAWRLVNAFFMRGDSENQSQT